MKTTNPSLLRRYFAGELAPGDCSKDFVIEPDYALVFNGKIPYRTRKVSFMIAWRDMNKEMHCNVIPEGHPAYKLVKGKVPTSGITIEKSVNWHLNRSFLILIGLFNTYSRPETQGEVDDLIVEFNEMFALVPDPELLWKRIDDCNATFTFIWNGRLQWDITDLDPRMAAGIMERRLNV